MRQESQGCTYYIFCVAALSFHIGLTLLNSESTPLLGQQLQFCHIDESQIITKSVKFPYCFAKRNLSQINPIKASRAKHPFYNDDLALFLTSGRQSYLLRAAAPGGSVTAPGPSAQPRRRCLGLSSGRGTLPWTRVYFSRVLSHTQQLLSPERPCRSASS